MFSERKKWKSWWSRFDAVIEELNVTSIEDNSSDAINEWRCIMLKDYDGAQYYCYMGSLSPEMRKSEEQRLDEMMEED
jgi:hypothetical protein